MESATLVARLRHHSGGSFLNCSSNTEEETDQEGAEPGVAALTDIREELLSGAGNKEFRGPSKSQIIQ